MGRLYSYVLLFCLLLSNLNFTSAESVNDQDSDGIQDDLDYCPDTFLFAHTGPDGCSWTQSDDDNDGIVNGLDKCPEFDSNDCSPFHWIRYSSELDSSILFCTFPEFTSSQLILPCRSHDGSHGQGETAGYVYNINDLKLDKVIPRVTKSSYSPHSNLLAVIVSGDYNPNEKFRIYEANNFTLIGEYSANGSVIGIKWNNSGDDFLIEINRGGNYVGYVQKYVIETNEIVNLSTPIQDDDNYVSTDHYSPEWPRYSPNGEILYDLQEEQIDNRITRRLVLEYTKNGSLQIFEPEEWESRVHVPVFKHTSDIFAAKKDSPQTVGVFEIYIGDYDNDGVNFLEDRCYHTGLGSAVDNFGCSESQLDSDGDLVPDSIDFYPNDPSRFEKFDVFVIISQYAFHIVGSILIVITGVFLHKPTLRRVTSAIRSVYPNAIGLERIERQREELGENVSFEVNMDSVTSVLLAPFVLAYYCVAGVMIILLYLIYIYLVVAAYALLILFGGTIFVIFLPFFLFAFLFG